LPGQFKTADCAASKHAVKRLAMDKPRRFTGPAMQEIFPGLMGIFLDRAGKYEHDSLAIVTLKTPINTQTIRKCVLYMMNYSCIS